jgi:hypothetical protein
VTDKEFTVDTDGFQGNGCAAVQKAFETMGTVTKDTPKPGAAPCQGQGNALTNGR